MIRTQVYIPDDLYRELKLLAKIQNVNFSSLIRQGVKEVIAKKKIKVKFNPWRHLVGKGSRGTPKDLSSKIDDFLYK